jgi:hypothetical protein
MPKRSRETDVSFETSDDTISPKPMKRLVCVRKPLDSTSENEVPTGWVVKAECSLPLIQGNLSASDSSFGSKHDGFALLSESSATTLTPSESSLDSTATMGGQLQKNWDAKVKLLAYNIKVDDPRPFPPELQHYINHVLDKDIAAPR